MTSKTTPVTVTWNPDWPAEYLRTLAAEHSRRWRRRHADPDSETREIVNDRVIVNMLRHHFTDYDDFQSAVRFDEACWLISADFPHLEAECDRQRQRRTESVEYSRKPGKHAGAPARSRHTAGECEIDYNGETVDAEIVEVTGTRVTVELETGNGRIVHRDIHVSDIRTA